MLEGILRSTLSREIGPRIKDMAPLSFHGNRHRLSFKFTPLLLNLFFLLSRTSLFFALSTLTISRAELLINLAVTSKIIKRKHFLETSRPRIEPEAAGWEARKLPLCIAMLKQLIGRHIMSKEAILNPWLCLPVSKE